MRILTAGESHGRVNVAIVEGFPKGLRIDLGLVNQELKRRMSGAGRGKRMLIEEDMVDILAGVRNKVTLGSPLALFVANRDAKIFAQRKDTLPKLTVPRPAHADLAGALKFQEPDIRNILERASARETVARVAVGAVCKQLLGEFGVAIGSYTTSVGSIASSKRPQTIAQVRKLTVGSQLNCIDRVKEKLMLQELARAQKAKDSLGGIVEVRAEGLCPGIGSVMHFDKRLDARLAAALVSIPAVKGVEFGLGFDYARARGSRTHDEILYAAKRGFYHKTNNSGGIEGGMSNGEAIVVRLAMKPIATLSKPLDSVQLKTKRKAKAIVERSDTCAIVACGVIAESMCAITLVEALTEKCGSDTLAEMKAHYTTYLKKSRSAL